MSRKYTRHDGELLKGERLARTAVEWQEYRDCTFRSSVYTECLWLHCRFHQTAFTKDCIFDRCRFLDCKFTGSRSVMGAAYRDCTFENCTIDNVEFWHGTFDTCRFPGSSLDNVQFNGAKAVATKVRRVDLSEARLRYFGFVNGIDTTQFKLPSAGLRIIGNRRNRFAEELIEAAGVPAGVERKDRLFHTEYRALLLIGESANNQDPVVFDVEWLRDMLHDSDQAAMFESIAAKHRPR